MTWRSDQSVAPVPRASNNGFVPMAARYAHILGREAVRLLARARQLTMNLLDAHATWP